MSEISSTGKTNWRLSKTFSKEWVASVAEHLIRSILPAEQRGFTFDPRRGIFPRFQRNVFIVSIKGHGRILKRLPSHQELSSWIRQNSLLLLRRNQYIGFWQSTESGLFYLDVSVARRGKESATQFARINGQEAIYDFANGLSIDVPISAPTGVSN